jgi:hypothetical protein
MTKELQVRRNRIPAMHSDESADKMPVLTNPGVGRIRCTEPHKQTGKSCQPGSEHPRRNLQKPFFRISRLNTVLEIVQKMQIERNIM